MPTYTRQDLQDQIVDPIIYASVGSQLTIQNILNRIARMVLQDADLRSTKRTAVITPNIFDEIYDYAAMSDLKEDALIDIYPQANRVLDSRISLVTPEWFDRKKSSQNLMVAVLDDSLTRRLKVNIDVTDDTLEVSDLDDTDAGGGTWAVFGDAANLTQDTDYNLEGTGCLKFDLTGAGTTAGIVNSTLTAIDISDYVNNGSLTVWVYINSTTNLTNFILRIGSSVSVYHSITVTTDNAGNSFKNGWNLIRFPFSSKSDTGTPNDTAITYVALYMTKTAGKSDDGYRFDDMVLHLGEIYEALYYSKYPWKSSAGTYLENSSSTTDYIVADSDELELFVLKGKMEVFRELRDYEQMKFAKDEYEQKLTRYKLKNPSERLLLEFKR